MDAVLFLILALVLALLIDRCFPSLFAQSWYQDTLAGTVREPRFVFCDDHDDGPEQDDVQYYQYGSGLVHPYLKNQSPETVHFIDDLYYDDKFESSY